VPLAVLEPTSATLLIALTIGFGIAVRPDGLPAIIENLQARGFHLVTISKLLESPAEPH